MTRRSGHRRGNRPEHRAIRSPHQRLNRATHYRTTKHPCCVSAHTERSATGPRPAYGDDRDNAGGITRLSARTTGTAGAAGSIAIARTTPASCHRTAHRRLLDDTRRNYPEREKREDDMSEKPKRDRLPGPPQLILAKLSKVLTLKSGPITAKGRSIKPLSSCRMAERL